MIKKIFCDIDGTLLHSKNVITDLYFSAKKNVPKKNITLINELKDIEFNFASGRIDSNLRDLEKNFTRNVKYKISLNGSLVTKDNKVFIEHKLNIDLAKDIVNYLENEKYFYFIFTNKGIFTGNKKIRNPIARTVRKWVGVPINKHNIKAEDLFDVYEDLSVYKFSINYNVSWYNLSKKVDKIREHYPSLSITESSNYSIDINPVNASKGEIIQTICKHDNISLDEIAVIGDSENDKSMFDVTPNSFCINHANKEIKEDVGYIVHNVSEALEIINDINKTQK